MAYILLVFCLCSPYSYSVLLLFPYKVEKICSWRRDWWVLASFRRWRRCSWRFGLPRLRNSWLIPEFYTEYSVAWE